MSFLDDGLRVSVNGINGLGKGVAVCRAEAWPTGWGGVARYPPNA
ncbi:hypothetical protein SAMN05444358_1011224 [Ruegeria halocynthiae]|uniref:Uncharacterized protein n=1 Tax=Ruegeria halocynthiae TaxID=985054 RepID=A0A1H2URE2_9RHOB|nr:hypothetical protein SAMN05444358_1011224 [Ruegeria halocynthiae]